MMNKSRLFKIAHQATKRVIQVGDNYRVTFGAVLKAMAAGWNAAECTWDEVMRALNTAAGRCDRNAATEKQRKFLAVLILKNHEDVSDLNVDTGFALTKRTASRMIDGLLAL